MARKIGAITVGQSPRRDVVPDMVPLLGNIDLIERGALDGLSAADIAALAPADGDYTLVTRLADGSSVHIAEKYILERLKKHIDDFTQATDIEAIIMLCTGNFPMFSSSKLLLYPQVLLQHFVLSTINDKMLGVLSPTASQIPQSTKRWQQNGVKQLIAAAQTPYGDKAAVVQAARQLQSQGAQMIVLDCIGYTVAMKQAIEQKTNLPVVLPRTVVARTLAELFG